MILPHPQLIRWSVCVNELAARHECYTHQRWRDRDTVYHHRLPVWLVTTIITLAHSMIASGPADVVMACGVENDPLPIGSDAIGRDKKMGKPISRSYFEQHVHESV